MKQTKKSLARLMALCLTLVMALSLTTLGAGAVTIETGSETASVTINGSANDEGADVNLYKIIDVNMDTTAVQPKDPVYKWNSAVASWLESNDTYRSYINATDDAVTEAYKNLSAKDLGTFLDALSESGVLTAAKTAKISNGTATVSGLAMGQYLVVATKTGNTYNPATVTLYPEWDVSGNGSWVLNNATVTLKSKGDIEKTVTSNRGDLSYAIGDTVSYRLDVAIPAYPSDATAKRFEIGDTMGTGLDFGGVSTVKVYASDNATTYTDGDLVNAGDSSDPNYTLTEVDNGFKIVFNYDNLKETVGADTYIHVVYTATLNESAFTNSLGNTAYVGVNTNPYDSGSFETTTVEKKVYTYGITVTKVDTNGATLSGAEFALKDFNGILIEFAKTNDGVYVKYDAGNYTAEDNVVPVTTLVATNGTLQLQGLDVGTYTLTETKAPGSYQLPDDEAAVTTITLTDDTEADGILDTDTTTAIGTMVVATQGSTTISNNVISFKIKNEQPGFTLPTTGGMGTVAFTAGGLVIMACGAALVLYTVKKRKVED